MFRKYSSAVSFALLFALFASGCAANKKLIRPEQRNDSNSVPSVVYFVDGLKTYQDYFGVISELQVKARRFFPEDDTITAILQSIEMIKSKAAKHAWRDIMVGGAVFSTLLCTAAILGSDNKFTGGVMLKMYGGGMISGAVMWAAVLAIDGGPKTLEEFTVGAKDKERLQEVIDRYNAYVKAKKD